MITSSHTPRVARIGPLAAICALVSALPAAPLEVNIAKPAPPATGYFKTGTLKSPSGQSLSVDSRSLRLDGKPFFPVMGEIHYSRVPESQWRNELLKMKAGGVTIVATYVFWIHHEEERGRWDWTGPRDLGKFLDLCKEAGLKVVVRCGPWCHGEVRNGGLPDWVRNSGWKLRSTDPGFMVATESLYREISKQLRGRTWKEGGPVIGIQVDNEFGGSPDYLMALKKATIAAGIDVPFYIKTGWPPMRNPVPKGELIPLFGGYADGFWDRRTVAMPGESWRKFTFNTVRTDGAIGNDTLAGESRDTAGTETYPYLTCEIGGGMAPSYHRRMNLDPRDVEAVALCQLGGGSSLMGYYMYHGGTNPEGTLSTLQESTATGYPNDLPVKNYDFNAPIGAFGQINPQYYWLRRLHLFLHDFGSGLAQMPASLPQTRPEKKGDTGILRWAARSDGRSGYVFVNNYERLRPLPEKKDVQFQLNLPGGKLVVPKKPMTIPSGLFFFFPFNLDLDGAKLVSATAQPVCRSGNVVYFAHVPGIPAEFSFDPATVKGKADFENVQPGREPFARIETPSGKSVELVLLSDADSLALQKSADGTVVFETPRQSVITAVTAERVREAGPARDIPKAAKAGVAAAPTDADFANAAVWRITLPKNALAGENPLLRIRYIGDAARLTLNGKLINDDFFTGRAFETGLKGLGPELDNGSLRLQILPLRKDAPIFIEPKNRPDFGGKPSLLQLESVEVVN